ncbi:glycosyltransferase involved in cell wall biosynthesis [Pontibacter ummariensis]|uniref:Glycosyltransferase involved in cell wall bisynthesis n=1 Tax=Pontibacter ummariensis TaxID=1610492 RepID=A0A239BP23_9BACT|nr:glycosyltransferase family 2 protein [Pontibacter ummariensis]PRY15741.1 glycosyltransferase involved in cell wall biosynthesis [Pontibacter ummariensis]SNS09111.1 Glycosyltransferase involved in cell wall bisynthesis [Pontibacter ummariensis]
MKVTIITIVFNNRETIADTIESVLGQTYPDIEYIVVDGLSTDGTVQTIKGYGNRIAKFISEEDGGLYDALNKGIRMATGDVIGFLHSDDIFYSKEAITAVAEAFKAASSDCVYADLVYVDREKPDKIVRNWKSGIYKRKSFVYGWMPPHPTFYVKREVYERLGLYDTAFKSAADYELMLRYLYRHGISTAYLPAYLVRMRVGGKSNSTLKNRIRANNEDYNAWLVNGLRPRFYTRYLKPLRKLTQFF